MRHACKQRQHVHGRVRTCEERSMQETSLVHASSQHPCRHFANQHNIDVSSMATSATSSSSPKSPKPNAKAWVLSTESPADGAVSQHKFYVVFAIMTHLHPPGVMVSQAKLSLLQSGTLEPLNTQIGGTASKTNRLQKTTYGWRRSYTRS